MTDFPDREFKDRTTRAQTAMVAAGLDALLLCTEAELRYFSGFRTLFWQSPTRPWYLVIPASGAPIAVIPSIGTALMQSTWVRDIRTWSSPHPNDEGIGLLVDALGGAARIGLPMGSEASLRMPLNDFNRLTELIQADFVDCTPLVQALRMVKSDAEIAVISDICGVASTAFSRAHDLFFDGQALNEAFRAFKIALLQSGAEDVPYLVGGADQGGYVDLISPPGNQPLTKGDVLMLDTGSTLQGYFCDFDRNFAIGGADVAACDAHKQLWDATEAGLEASRPGASCVDVFDAMHAALGGGSSDVGRYGHGLGMQLTEWPSICSHDRTELRPGMVMTLEPSMPVSDGKMMVAEENILITDGAPQMLTTRVARDLPVIKGT